MIDATGMPQTAVVIGGTSDIARAIVGQLVDQRLKKVVLAGRNLPSLDPVAEELGERGVETATVAFDVTDVASASRLAREVAAQLGQVDLVLMAAGVLGDQDSDKSDPLSAAQVLETNFTGPAAALVAFASLLEKQGYGRLVVLSSVAGVRVRKANYVYGASKAGLDAFAQGMSDDLRGSGVSLIIVRPGWVATRMTAGREPGPMATTADKVAADVVRGLQRGSAVVWSPPQLRLVFGVMRHLPGALWRRLPR